MKVDSKYCDMPNLASAFFYASCSIQFEHSVVCALHGNGFKGFFHCATTLVIKQVTFETFLVAQEN
jgi:hypothetical protein